MKAFISESKPNLVVVSGDLTQRAKSKEFLAAKNFLLSLQTQQIVVPGNHDVPLWNIWQRFFSPFEKYKKHIAEDLSPVFEDDEISVIGLNTAHSGTIAGGHFSATKLENVARRWKGLEKTKIIVSHHPFEFFLTEKPVKRWGYKNTLPSEMALNLQTDLLLSGHFHSGDSSSSAQILKAPHRSVLSIQAGTATSTRLRKDQNSFNRIFIYEGEVKIEKWVWEETEFKLQKEKVFVINESGWCINSSRGLD